MTDEVCVEEIINEYGSTIVTVIGIGSGVGILIHCISMYKDSIFNMLASIMYR